MDLTADVYIHENSQLVITSRVSMPKNGRIFIEKGGQLVLKSTARLQNACGFLWDGIFSKNPVDRQVLIEEGAEIIISDEL